MSLSNQETSSFESFIPFLIIIGVFIFFYYGYRGVVKKKTISLYKHRGFSASESQELFGSTITGTTAVIFGIIYILMGLLFLFLALKIFNWSTIFGI